MRGFGGAALGLVVCGVGLLEGAGAQDTWCGKVYKPGIPQVIPGGRLERPVKSVRPLLHVQVAARHSIYVASEKTAEFIVDAALSYFHGAPVDGAGENGVGRLNFTIETHGTTLVTDGVSVNTTGALFKFHLAQLEPRPSAYRVTLQGCIGSDGTRYEAWTDLFYLPERSTGSVVKIDRLYGSLLYRNSFTGASFRPVFPYGFYGSYSGYFGVKTSNIEAYVSRGFNAVNIVSELPDLSLESLEKMDQVNLLFQYDMRASYRNLTSVAAQVALVKDHPALLTWYTADEPDGWQYDLNSTTLAYDKLAELDRYHPTALVLNCQNYYYKEYSAGADIIMEDAYPIAISPNLSKWGTICNETIGDCGCDNCEGSVLDVPARIDHLHQYQEWIGGSTARKPVWAVPQAFSDGSGSYWTRDPTVDEAWAMDVLAINHGAKGRLAWIYPSSDLLAEAAAKLATAIQTSLLHFLTAANPVLIQDGRHADLDVAHWLLPSGLVLLGIVNPRNAPVKAARLRLPDALSPSAVASEPWGSAGWAYDGSELVARGELAALATSFVILK